MSKYVTTTEYLRNRVWMLCTNLHAGDVGHRLTCCMELFACKPTKKQVRRHRATARAWRRDNVAHLR